MPGASRDRHAPTFPDCRRRKLPLPMSLSVSRVSLRNWASAAVSASSNPKDLHRPPQALRSRGPAPRAAARIGGHGARGRRQPSCTTAALQSAASREGSLETSSRSVRRGGSSRVFSREFAPIVMQGVSGGHDRHLVAAAMRGQCQIGDQRRAPPRSLMLPIFLPGIAGRHPVLIRRRPAAFPAFTGRCRRGGRGNPQLGDPAVSSTPPAPGSS